MINIIGNTIPLFGAINLPINLGDELKIVTINVLFNVINTPVSYNAILGWTTINP